MSAFPLVTLRPVADAQQRWQGLLLSCEPAPTRVDLEYILHAYGLTTLVQAVGFRVWLDGGVPADATDLDLVSLPADLAAQALPAATAVVGTAPMHGLLLKLIALTVADADVDELESVIKRDANLSYQLLKLVNSVAYAPGKKIVGFGQAIALLGRRQLQRWLQLLVYARPAGAPASPWLPRAAMRASLMETLARRSQWSYEMQEHAFMVGMFSLLDRVFGKPLADIVVPLNLAEAVVDGLVGTPAAGSPGGRLQALLRLTLCNENCPDATLAAALTDNAIDSGPWAAAVVEALRWAATVSKEA